MKFVSICLLSLLLHLYAVKGKDIWFCGSPNNNCYYSDDTTNPWEDSVAKCKAKGMHLPTGGIWAKGFWLNYNWQDMWMDSYRVIRYVDPEGNHLPVYLNETNNRWYLSEGRPNRFSGGEEQHPIIVYPHSGHTSWIWEDSVNAAQMRLLCQINACENTEMNQVLHEQLNATMIESLNISCPKGDTTTSTTEEEPGEEAAATSRTWTFVIGAFLLLALLANAILVCLLWRAKRGKKDEKADSD